MKSLIIIVLFFSASALAKVENERLVFSCEVFGRGDDPGPERYAINLYQLGRNRFALKEVATEFGVTKVKTFSDELKGCQHLKEQPLVFDCLGPMSGQVSQIFTKYSYQLALGRQAEAKPIERHLINIYVLPGKRLNPDYVFSPEDCNSSW